MAYSRIHEHRSVLNALCASVHFHLTKCMAINNSIIIIFISMGIACSRHCPERSSDWLKLGIDLNPAPKFNIVIVWAW